MNIGVYGHSITMYLADEKDHFITLLKNHFDARIVHSGIVQCSEERILFNLKKTKQLDLAIIFHSAPHYLFIPAWNRDLCAIDKSFFSNKIKIRDWAESIGVNDCEMEETINWLNIVPNNSISELAKHFDIEFHNYSDVLGKWLDGDHTDLKQLLIENARQSKNDKKFFSELFDALVLYKKYMSHPDLSMNRFYGAMIQIDSYLKYKKIPCVHFLDRAKWYPVWHTFESGPLNTNLSKIGLENSKYMIGYDNSSNGINAEGNKLIFEEIILMLDAASSIKENALSDQLREGGLNPPAAPVTSESDLNKQRLQILDESAILQFNEHEAQIHARKNGLEL